MAFYDDTAFKLIDMKTLSFYLNVSIDYIFDHKESIIGAVYINKKWLFNLYIIRSFIEKNRPYIVEDVEHLPLRIRNWDTRALLTITGYFVYKRESYIRYLNRIIDRLKSNEINKQIKLNCIKHLFNSSRKRRDDIDIHGFYFLLPYLSFAVEKLFMGPPTDFFCAATEGGLPHLFLSKMIMLHVYNYNGTGMFPDEEQEHNGKRVDIYDNDNGNIYEIGDTDATALVKHYIDSSIKAVYLVPFQNHDYNFVMAIRIFPTNRDKLINIIRQHNI